MRLRSHSQCGVCRRARLGATTGRGEPAAGYGAGRAGGNGGAEAGDRSVVSLGGGGVVGVVTSTVTVSVPSVAVMVPPAGFEPD